MRSMLTHITALEAPIVWLAFAAGALLGAAGTWLFLHKRQSQRS